MNRIFLPIIVMIGIVAIYATYRWDFWVSNKGIQTTENAYIDADITPLSSKVSGHLVTLSVRDYQAVEKGDVIAKIDDREYLLQLEKAQATYQKEAAILKNLTLEIAQQEAVVAQAQANIEMAKIRVDQQEKHFERQKSLVGKGALSQEKFEDTKAAFNLAVKSYAIAEALFLLETRALELLHGQKLIREAEKKSAFTAVEIAQDQLADTVIKAPFSGYLGKIIAKEGEIIKINTPIVTMIPSNALYIVANFKETQFANIHRQQLVEILVDALPGNKFTGTIEEISPMSGAKASQLPIINTAGNFTKIVQRIPVKISLDKNHPQYLQLRVGMSVRVKVDTQYLAP